MAYASISAMRPGVSQTVAFTGASATSTNPFGTETYVLRVSADAACFFKIVEGAAGGNAGTSDIYLPANWVDYVVVTPGQKISAIRAPTDGLVTATSGTLSAVEMS